jgi:hypothetical protein
VKDLAFHGFRPRQSTPVRDGCKEVPDLNLHVMAGRGHGKGLT